LLRAISANIREVIQADVVAISLPDAASGKLRVFAVDFPHARGSSLPPLTSWCDDLLEVQAHGLVLYHCEA